MEILRLTVDNNDFTFGSETFLQILGMAMGKTYATGLAYIYLVKFDNSALTGLPIKPRLYFRFLDDVVFFLWPGTRHKLGLFEDYLNNRIVDVKITLVSHTEHIDFLDTTVYKY